MDLAVVGMILFGALVAFAVVRYMVGAAPLRLPRVSGIFTAAAFPITVIALPGDQLVGRRRSVGKKLVGLRVVRSDGRGSGRCKPLGRAIVCTLSRRAVAAVGGLQLAQCRGARPCASHHRGRHDWSDEVRTEIELPPPPAVVAS